MLLSNKQGLHMVEQKKKIRQMILDFLPNAQHMTQRQICEVLNITPQTLRRHLKEIEKGV